MRCIVGAQLTKSGTLTVPAKPGGAEALVRIVYATRAATIHTELA